MRDEARRHEDVQRRIFAQLARDGVYDAGHLPPPKVEAFMRTCIEAAAPASGRTALRVLDCGCGAGMVLQVLRSVLDQRSPAHHRYYGFDLSPDMIAVARRHFPEIPPARLRVGSVLDAESYVFDAEEPLFDLVCCKAVVEQVPPPLQFQAIEAMLEHVRTGGVGVFFEKERHSGYGMAMGARKFITRHLGVPLVPRFFTAARYPPLARFCRRLAKQPQFAERSRQLRPRVMRMPAGPLRALIVGVEAAGAARGE